MTPNENSPKASIISGPNENSPKASISVYVMTANDQDGIYAEFTRSRPASTCETHELKHSPERQTHKNLAKMNTNTASDQEKHTNRAEKPPISKTRKRSYSEKENKHNCHRSDFV